jgi:hypothetical protein
MASDSPQKFGNHARYVQLYHFVLFGLLIVNLFHAGRLLARHISDETVYGILLAAALLILAWYARAFPLSVQDRVIRLELRLRMQALTPELLPRFAQLTPVQVTALRFAGDGELEELARAVLDGKLARGDDIKKAIKDWQPDLWRA